MKARAALVCIALLLAACGRQAPWHLTDISGAMPPLEFSMTRANDGQAVAAGDYRGKVTVLYFGYTHCPDVCPTTLANLSGALKQLGHKAKNVRVLFVSVDPDRDTLPVLKSYVAAFAPQVDGLRGNPNALTALTRRYRAIYNVTPASPGHAYEVTHSNTIYVFDRTGRARLVGTSTQDTRGIADDVERLLGE
ncbi:MAG TPA: SCO family protein [Rhizomicrobium sp.]|jgi:protein SCO1/2|nr:SCO family protein [Rhizomicrobium sp.]